MGRYESRRESDLWKERTCTYCACVYRSRLPRKKPEYSDADESAKSEIDLSPCPNCGRYQPEMVGKLRFKWHLLAMLANVIWLLPLLANFFWMPRWVAILTTAVFAIPLILVQLWIITGYPNNRWRTNQTRARYLLADDKLRIGPDTGKRPPDWTTPASVRPGMVFWILLLLTVASLTLFLACDVLRQARGWPANPGWRPEVVGPGDSNWVDFPNEIRSVKGYWMGSATAKLQVVDDPNRVIPLEATTRTDNWGDRIEVRGSEENQASTLWAKVRLPDDPTLAGKKVRIQMKMRISYPAIHRAREFLVKEEQVEHTAEAQLASPKAGTVYYTVWFVSMLTPLLVLIVLQLYCVGRAQRLKGSSNAVMVGDKPKDEDDAEEPRPVRRKDVLDEDDEDAQRGRFR